MPEHPVLEEGFAGKGTAPNVLPLLGAGLEVNVRVPATSANLGPGFDSMGLALGLYDSILVRTADTGSTVVNASGEGVEALPDDHTHLVARSVLETLEKLGWASPGLELDTVNVIPHGRGLGSSAAAIVSGVLAANALVPSADQLDLPGLLQWCSELEGHPDNVAPALLGSLAISWDTGGTYRSVRVKVHPDIIPIAAIPAGELSTATARSLLPAVVAHRDAAANSGRAALLLHALTSDPGLLLPATRDFLHQEHRAQAMAPSAAIMHAMRDLGFASVISGAGPTLMTLVGGEQEARRALDALAGLTADSCGNGSWRVCRLEVAREGAKVEVHQR